MADGILTQRVRPTFEQFVSYVFEEAARTYVARLARSGQLSSCQSGLEVGWDPAMKLMFWRSATSSGRCWWESVNGLIIGAGLVSWKI